MYSCVFASSFLKYKNNKIHILSNENDFNEVNYEDNTYFINLDDIKKTGSINYNDKIITYDLLSFDEDKNISVKINFMEDIGNEDMIKLMHLTDLYLTGIDDIDELSIDENIVKKYSNKYFRI
jgi:hypothetical protein